MKALDAITVCLVGCGKAKAAHVEEVRWRDSVRPAIARPLVVGDPVAFVRARRRGHPRAGVVTEVGTVCEINDLGNGRRSVSVVTAWVHGDGSDQRLDGTTRWLLPESWCTRIVARAAKGGAR